MRCATSASAIRSRWLQPPCSSLFMRSTSRSYGGGSVGKYRYPSSTLPFWVPFAMLGVETRVHRRNWMRAFLAVGTMTSVALLVAVIAGPVGASIDGSHIAYSANISYAGILIALYIVATCGSCLVASNRWLVLLGLANLSAVIALGWVTFTGFTSLWCAWAALTSVAIAVYLRRSARTNAPTGVAYSTSR